MNSRIFWKREEGSERWTFRRFEKMNFPKEKTRKMYFLNRKIRENSVKRTFWTGRFGKIREKELSERKNSGKRTFWAGKFGKMNFSNGKIREAEIFWNFLEFLNFLVIFENATNLERLAENPFWGYRQMDGVLICFLTIGHRWQSSDRS